MVVGGALRDEPTHLASIERVSVDREVLALHNIMQGIGY
jgi:hypothetical protein